MNPKYLMDMFSLTPKKSLGQNFLHDPQAMEKIVASAKAHGKPTGILAPVEKDARRYLDMGMTFVAVGGDVGLLRSASKALCDKFKS